MRANLFAELKRRNVFKVAITYAVVGWLLIQIAAIIFSNAGAPSSVLKILIALLTAGLFIAIAISWFFEATPEGLKRTERVPMDATLPTWSKRKHTTFLLVVAAMAASLLAFQLLRSKPSNPSAIPSSAEPAEPP